MRISMIVAVAANGVIGRDGELPWHLPEDLKHFKRITLGKPIVMGRKTWESIGRPLPGRHNVIVTRTEGYVAEGASVVNSPEAALALLAGEDEVMIIGGGAIYQAFLKLADRIYLTRVDATVEGDASFPELDAARWSEMSRDRHAADERHAHPFTFIQLDRSE